MEQEVNLDASFLMDPSSLPFVFQLGEEAEDAPERKLGCETDYLTDDRYADTD